MTTGLSKVPTVKYLIPMALIATAMLAAPGGHADPDPHKPDFGANYCPGGATAPPDATCDGVPYDDGSYWHATQRGTSSNYSYVVVQCVKPPPPPGPFAGLMPPLPPGPIPAGAGGCGGP
jgi:hypothetical protein